MGVAQSPVSGIQSTIVVVVEIGRGGDDGGAAWLAATIATRVTAIKMPQSAHRKRFVVRD